MGDPFILEYGFQLVQTSNNVKRRTVVVRNKMRECARILIEFRRMFPESVDSIATIIGEYVNQTYEELGVSQIGAATALINNDPSGLWNA